MKMGLMARASVTNEARRGTSPERLSCQFVRGANVFASGISISEPPTATTTIMTTTFGSSKLWLATTSAAAMFRCDVPRPSTNLVSLAGPPRSQPAR